jgi:hypothetical protein
MRRDALLRVAAALTVAALASAALPPPAPRVIASHPLGDLATDEAGNARGQPSGRRGPLASAARFARRVLRIGAWGRHD